MPNTPSLRKERKQEKNKTDWRYWQELDRQLELAKEIMRKNKNVLKKLALNNEEEI